MHFPFDLVISHINIHIFPTKTSLKKYIEENMQLGYVTKIRFISVINRDRYTIDTRFFDNCNSEIQEFQDEGMEDFTTIIPNIWECNVSLVRYRAIIELEWDFSKEWNIDINKIPKYSCSSEGSGYWNKRMHRPMDWYQYYIGDNTDFMDISIKTGTQNPVSMAKYLCGQSTILQESQRHIENLLYDQTNTVNRINYLESQIEKMLEKENESQERIENLLYDKFEMAARIHLLETQIQQILEKENNKSLLSYIFDKNI
jgi:hypothetical protein